MVLLISCSASAATEGGRGRRPGGGAGCPKAALQLVRRKTRSAKLRAPLGRRAARWPRKLDRKRCKLARLLPPTGLSTLGSDAGRSPGAASLLPGALAPTGTGLPPAGRRLTLPALTHRADPSPAELERHRRKQPRQLAPLAV